MTEDRGNRKSKTGRVISNKMDKTVVVTVESTTRHPKYEKVIRRRQKLYAHHDGEPLSIGDEVTVVETRPLSKLKRWRVVENVESKK